MPGQVLLSGSFMASPPILDFAALIAPIPGDNPAGAPVPYETKERFEELRKEIDPETYSPDDPMRPEQPTKADWPEITRVAIRTLTTTSKDLLIAARLTEALVKLYDFAGLRDGLHLLRLLVDECWDRLYPPIEEGDLDLRIGPFNWLDVADRGARFPNTVRSIPFIFFEGAKYNLLDRKTILEGRGPISPEELERAVQGTPLGTSRQTLEDINQALENLNQLTGSLNSRMGEAAAPGMTGLRPAMEECRFVLQQIVQNKTGEAESAPAANEAAEGIEGQAVGTEKLRGSRAEAYRQLAQAAALLRQLEPHSPIPYLVQRAVELGSKPFPELIRALIRDANVLSELNRELGIKPPSE
jgi:type VI secretion system protein ImpA